MGDDMGYNSLSPSTGILSRDMADDRITVDRTRKEMCRDKNIFFPFRVDYESITVPIGVQSARQGGKTRRMGKSSVGKSQDRSASHENL
jgi:hypothetical protein